MLICKATETVSFAQGNLMMVGASVAFAGLSMFGLPYWLAVLLAIGSLAALGMLLERAVIRPIVGQPQFTIVMLTIGIAYLLRGLVTMVPGIGTDTRTLAVPYKGQVWRFGELVVNVEQCVVIVVTAPLCAALFALFRFTKLGIAMQAAAQNQPTAYYRPSTCRRRAGAPSPR